MTDVGDFRAEFPALEHVAYFNAGTDGPVPMRAAEAAAAQARHEAELGRVGGPYSQEWWGSAAELRAGYAALLGCSSEEVAITRSTTDGVNTILLALDLGPDAEVLTTDEEHPGLLAPLGAARARRGVDVRVVPWDEIAGAVGPRTRLIACSHISWKSGRTIDVDALAATEVPVLLDGAQGIGAVPVDVKALGCDFYAASGQKWLCGPNGSGCLYVSEEQIGGLTPPWPSFFSLADPRGSLDLVVHGTAARLDVGMLALVDLKWALAALEVFRAAGWDWVFERSADLAARLAARLAQQGLEVSPRGPTTLVSWRAANAFATVERLAADGIAVRSIPDRGFVRASVGAWISDEEIERLVALAAAADGGGRS